MEALTWGYLKMYSWPFVTNRQHRDCDKIEETFIFPSTLTTAHGEVLWRVEFDGSRVELIRIFSPSGKKKANEGSDQARPVSEALMEVD